MPDEQARPNRRLRVVPTTSRCHGYANGCACSACRRRAHIVATHVKAGRNPYTPDGKLRPLPVKRRKSNQPWDPGPPRSRSA